MLKCFLFMKYTSPCSNLSLFQSPEDIVDIKIGSFVPDSPVSTPQAPRYTPATTAAVTPVGDLLSRKKAEMDLKVKQAAQSEQDLISTIISRRRRAVRIFQFESKSIFYTFIVIKLGCETFFCNHFRKLNVYLTVTVTLTCNLCELIILAFFL